MTDTPHIERPNVNEWSHPTFRSSKHRCLRPFDEPEMRKCKDFIPSGDVFKCLYVSRVDYTTCCKDCND